MRPSERIGRFGDRIFDRMRDRQAFTVTEADASDESLESLRGHTYALVVTFRRNGDPVPSPVWFAVDDRGRVFLHTRHDAGKVKRLRHDSRVLIAASTARGKPTGPVIRAVGRVLPRKEWVHAEATLASAYGAGRRIAEAVIGGREEAGAYIEITVPGSRSA